MSVCVKVVLGGKCVIEIWSRVLTLNV